MMKYIRYLFGFILLCAQGMAMQGVEEKAVEDFSIGIGIAGKSKHFTYRSIRDGDAPLVAQVAEQCKRTDGFPDNPTTWAENHIKRQKLGNSFSALILESEGVPVGVLGFGRMTVLNYDPKHVDIINTYVELGVTRFVNPDAAQLYAKENIVRVENSGLAQLLPILPESLGIDKRREAIQIGVEAVKFLKGSTKLPLEGTTPTHLIGLFHPDDSLVPLLDGFTIMAKEGYAGYYSTEEVIKKRVFAYLKL